LVTLAVAIDEIVFVLDSSTHPSLVTGWFNESLSKASMLYDEMKLPDPAT